MSDSIFFELKMVDPLAKFTAFERELLGMTLEANPGVLLGVALQDVFDFLEVKPRKGQLEAIGERLVRDHQKQAQPEEDGKTKTEGTAQKKTSDFGESLVKWINNLHSSDRLLVATGFDLARARQIYCEEDYAYTDRICKLYLESSWENSLIHLQAASAPWQGGKSGGRGQPDEYFDMSSANDDDPQWKELASCFGGGN